MRRKLITLVASISTADVNIATGVEPAGDRGRRIAVGGN